MNSPVSLADLAGPLWAVTSYFNPAGYRRRKANYRVFRERLPLPLLTVEWSPTGQFELQPGDADILIQLTGGDVMWQKERLLNIGVERLPSQCKHVAWVDCDLVFEREGLREAILNALDAVPAVQLYDRAAYVDRTPIEALARFGRCADRTITMERTGSAAAYVAAARSGTPMRVVPVATERMDEYKRLHSVGFAWAAHRELLERFTSLAQRFTGEVGARRIHQQIENQEHRWRFRRELLYPTGGGMDPLKQGIEREYAAVRRDHDLTVQHELLRLKREDHLHQFREIAGERLPGLGLQLHVLSIPENEAAKAVPLWLVLPFGPGGNLVEN